MGKPLLLLDVDGPLNPWAARSTPKGYTVHRLSPKGWRGPPLRVRLSHTHGPLLSGFADTHGLDMAWATTWAEDANTMIGPVIGLPELPVIDFGGGQPGALPGWKYPSVSAYAQDRPLVWLDDDFQISEYAQAKAQFLNWRDGHAATLLLQINPAIGITETDMLTVAEWVKAL